MKRLQLQDVLRAAGRAMLAGTLAVLAMLPCAAQAQPSGEGYSTQFADYVMKRWPDPNTITSKGWEYENGIVLHGLEKVSERTSDTRYLEYIKSYTDQYIMPNGDVNMATEDDNLDVLQPGVLLLYMYEQTGDEKYHAPSKFVLNELINQPRNHLGGFWHKGKYPNEMWVDGIYMAQPFGVKYARLFDEHTGNYGEAITQIKLANAKAKDPKTGLLFHGWDADKNVSWADPQSGQAPIIWSRGMGWYAMALVDVLENLPEDHPSRDELMDILAEVVAGLEQTQDEETGVWFQVMDQPEREGNWPEISGSAMFVYAINKGIRLGLIDEKYQGVADRGWEGVQQFVKHDEAGDPQITEVVQGMGIQDNFENYVNKKRLVNSPHGLCAIMFAASEMEFKD